MPTTRKKTIKPIYKDEEDDLETGDFSDSGSEARVSELSSSEEDEEGISSSEEFQQQTKNTRRKPIKKDAKPVVKTKFAKSFISKINKQVSLDDSEDVAPLFSVKDLSDADKLLPPVLNLSDSDSSDDESPKPASKSNVTASTSVSMPVKDSESEEEPKNEYRDVWSANILDNSEEIARKTFLELEKHKNKIEEAKASIENYTAKVDCNNESDVKDLLAQGEDVIPEPVISKKGKTRKRKNDSDSDMEDWEEVKESKIIPQQGLQLVVDFPDAVYKKTKKVDVKMMMKRKLNRVKKEYQVYMHKVHVLCWLGHGNYVSQVLNNQEVLAAVLSLVPSKECYPGARVDIKYVTQITSWFKDKLTLKQDKNEDKFKPKAPPLKDLLLSQIKNRVVTTKKHLVFIFVSMLRALGLQCRVMFNFVTLPIKPPSSELCSLSTKSVGEKKSNKGNEKQEGKQNKKGSKSNKCKAKPNIPQVDGYYDSLENEIIMQLDGNDDISTKPRTKRTTRACNVIKSPKKENDDVTPPKRAKKTSVGDTGKTEENKIRPQTRILKNKPNITEKKNGTTVAASNNDTKSKQSINTRKMRSTKNVNEETNQKPLLHENNPGIVITSASSVSSSYFTEEKTNSTVNKINLSRKRSHTENLKPAKFEKSSDDENKLTKSKTRSKSTSGKATEKSKYFNESSVEHKTKDENHKITPKRPKLQNSSNDKKRVSHRDLADKTKTANDVTTDLKDIVKKRIKEEKAKSELGVVKGKGKRVYDEDSDYLPDEDPKHRNSDSDNDFKHTKISPKPSTSRKVDRRVLSTDNEETSKNKCNIWCEVFVEELEQWIAVDVVKAKVHCTNEIYNGASHPVCYIVGWDNNNYLKDLTRRYVPHWNTVTRKQRADPLWWSTAIQPWLGPKTARDKEEDEKLDRMQLEAPLPKSISEYKNHPLYALKRHLLKFEAIYPPDASTLGFVRGEPVYARDCVYVCRSRDIWLKEAKVVRLGEKPYKIVKARPKWDRLSNKLITDKPLEIFGPWQIQDYEPPLAENGIVPRNPYGNVELFKACMLPKGTVHVKLPGLHKVAKKLNIDCAPAMTGFDYHGGYAHPVYDGYVVCKEFEEIITEAWVKDQEDQERRDREKIEARVYGNWRRLIKGLFIRERLKNKYGFENPTTSQAKKKPKGPHLVVKKNK